MSSAIANMEAAVEHIMLLEGTCQAEVERLVSEFFPEPEDGWRIVLFYLLISVRERGGEVCHGDS